MTAPLPITPPPNTHHGSDAVVTTVDAAMVRATYRQVTT